MVKGISKRVVVVRPSDNDIFEEAIFFVRTDRTAEGRSQEDIIKEAHRVAEGYTHTKRVKKHTIVSRIPAPVYAAVGAAGVGVAWVLTAIF